MGFICSKSMNENMKNQQEFMLMNARLQLERQLMMQNEMRERQMAMQVAWSREFLKYFGTFFGIAAISLTAGAIKRKKPAFLFPIIPLGFVLTYQYDLGYGTLLQRMKVVEFLLSQASCGSGRCPFCLLVVFLKWLFEAANSGVYLCCHLGFSLNKIYF
ncbi:plasminogen receptor (KT) isoform X1 [Myotis yumanensis]|uniref:plasminogen receptor (KT) isoform X1 n=1 Tax=Myotis yumanensis TaxID=159337 RepID=UPI0038D42157